MTYEAMSKEELVTALKDAQADLERARSAVENERVVHDLQVHQIELEMQNRELREAQGALEQSRARYADLYDYAPIAYCTLEKDGRIIEANLSATAYFGHDRTALIGRPLSTLVVPDDRLALRNHLRRCAQDKARVTTEVRMLLTDLGATSFQLVSTPIVAEGGVVTGCKTAITDVSQLKRTEERLHLLATASLTLARSFDLEKNLTEVVKSLVPAAADLCFADVYAESGEVTRVAVAAADPSRQAVAEALRRPPTPRTTLTDPLLVSDDPAAVLSHAIGDSSEREAIINACGARSVMLVPMGSKGRVIGLLGLITADSARRYTSADLAFARDLGARGAMAIENAQLYRAVERSREVRQDILAVVSHELKTPLTGISLVADALALEAPAGDERRKSGRHVERIKRSIGQMRHMIDDLLDFTSLETGRLSIVTRPTPVSEVLREAVELLAPLAAEKRLSLELVPGAADPLAVVCDKQRVLQVLSNLVGNAVKFTPEGGKITLASEAVTGHRSVQLTVRDTGPGLPKQAMLHLFQRYWQASETASKGRGLGLFIAKGIVEAHGGAIWVESQLHHGTAFQFTLPRAELSQVEAAPKADDAAAPAERPAAAPAGGKKAPRPGAEG